jgi:peptidoglycan-associated lipoprotein
MEVILKKKSLVQLLRLLLIVVMVLGLNVSCKSGKKGSGTIPASDMSQAEDEATPDADGSSEVSADLQRINFDYDKYTIRGDAQDILASTAEYLKSHSDVWIQIEGHCDDRGSAEYNLALGEKRANAAKEYLVGLGVAAKRLSVISYGEEKALEQGANEEAWAMNRRAEFIIVSKGN